jgi:hypothetical protein
VELDHIPPAARDLERDEAFPRGRIVLEGWSA